MSISVTNLSMKTNPEKGLWPLNESKSWQVSLSYQWKRIQVSVTNQETESW